MLNSLNSGVSGIQQFQERLDVIGNNIANSDTIAYKSARADFADAFSQTLQAPSASTPGITRRDALMSVLQRGWRAGRAMEDAHSGQAVSCDKVVSGPP